MPNVVNRVPISRAVLIFLFLPWKLSSDGKVGLLSAIATQREDEAVVAVHKHR